MNCQKFESIVSELARDQMMEAELRVDALSHSNECSPCATHLRSEEMLTSNLYGLAAETELVQAPDRVERHLVQAFRERKGLQPRAKVTHRARYWLGAVAAVLLVFAVAVFIRWRSFSVAPEIPEVAINGIDKKIMEPARPVRQSALLQSTDGKHEGAAPKLKRRSMYSSVARLPDNRNKATTVAANHAVKEIATDFMPVGYLNAANLQDGGQIIRVELPRSAMVSFGLQVNMDRYNEKVKADVLLGVDGVAHAIRFVQ